MFIEIDDPVTWICYGCEKLYDPRKEVHICSVFTGEKKKVKVAEYRLVPVKVLETFKAQPTKQRAFDAAFEANANGEAVKVVKVITEKNKKGV